MRISFLFLLLTICAQSQSVAQTSSFNNDSTDFFYQDFTYGAALSGWSILENGTAYQDFGTYFSDFASIRLEFEPSFNIYDFRYNVEVQSFIETINAWVLMPIDISNIDSISLYAIFDLETDDNDEFDGIISRSYAPSELQIDNWSKLAINIPSHIKMQSYGIRINPKTDTGIPDIYVDLFTSDPNYIGRASLGTVENLVSDSISSTYTAFSWDEPIDNVSDRYLIMRDHNYSGDFSAYDTTSNLYYIDTNVLSSSDYFYGVYALDSLNRRTQLYQGLLLKTLDFKSASNWDFEKGEEGWNTTSALLTSNIDTLAYSDRTSLKITSAKTSLESSFFKSDEELDSLISGQTIFYHIWIDEISKTDIKGFQAYYKHGKNWLWESNWFETGSFDSGSWNKISVQIPASLPIDSLKEIGIQLVKKESNTTPSFFVDLITTDPEYQGIPIISKPTAFKAVPGYNEITLNWSPSEGIGDIKYYLQYFTRNTRPPLTTYIETTDTTHTFEDFEASTLVDFILHAKDETGKVTEQIELSVSTKDFTSRISFDFERGSEGWFDLLAGEPATIVDSVSYSGIYSIRLETPEDEQFSNIGFNFPDVEPQQKVTFHFLVPHDTSNIRGISISSFYDGIVTFEETLINKFEPGEWGQVSYTIPGFEEYNTLGFNVVSKNTGAPPFYIDLITTEPDPIIRPHLTIPSNLTAYSLQSDYYEIRWKPSTGNDNVRIYNIYRADEFANTNEDFKLVGSTSDTTFTENGLNGGTVKVRVVAISDKDETSLPSEALSISLGLIDGIEDELKAPKNFELYHNYPNPFNPSTQIRFDIPEVSNVTIKVYDISGRLVQTLVNELKSPGKYSIAFNANKLSSGVYVYRIKAGSFIETKRMLLIK